MTMDSHSGDCSEPMLCFDRKTLSAFLAGTYGKDSSSLELHLEQCQECRSLLQKIEEEPDSVGVLLQGIELQEVMKETEKADRDLPAKETNDGGDWVLQHRELGAYELIEPLGRGGMGSVYLALHQALGKQVAIKVLPRGMLTNSDAIARFQRETLAAGRLDHSAIVRATDAGEHRGIHYLVMDRIRGLDLSRLARALGPMPIADACEMIRQVALGLTYAHEQGMVHRDIKPSNLMLDESGQVKILDFGLVQFDGWDSPQQELTTVGQLMGTLDYMAPEQAERSGGVDHRADLYSLGATLFRLLSGRAPLVATPHQSPLEKLRLLIHHQPPSLRLFCPSAPEALVALVDQLLDSDPKKRPPSAAHVALALEPFTSGHNLKACLQKGMQVKDVEPSQQARVPFPTASKSSIAQPQSTEPSQPQGSGRRYRNWIFAIAMALLPLASWFGYILVLDAQTGQLVIDSEVSGIQVKLVRGKEATSLSIETGTTTSRLWVDRYEIILETPSDTVEIENGAFSIRRGKTVVARIRTKSNADRVDGSAPNVVSFPNEPRYEDRTFSQWLEVLENERSNAKIKEALMALRILRTQENDEIIAAILREKVIPKSRLRSALFHEDEGSVFYWAISLLVKETQAFDDLKPEFLKENESVRFGILCYVHRNSQVQNKAQRDFYRWVFQQTQPINFGERPKIKLSEKTNDLFVALLWKIMDEKSEPADFRMLLDTPAKHWVRGFFDIKNLPEFLMRNKSSWDEIRLRLAERWKEENIDFYDESCTRLLLSEIGFGTNAQIRKALIDAMTSSFARFVDTMKTSEQFEVRWQDENAWQSKVLSEIGINYYPRTNTSTIGPVPVPFVLSRQNIPNVSLEAIRTLQLFLYVPKEDRPQELLENVMAFTESEYQQTISRYEAYKKEEGQSKQRFRERLFVVPPQLVVKYLCHLMAKLLIDLPVYPIAGEAWDELHSPSDDAFTSEADVQKLEKFKKLDHANLGFVSWSTFCQSPTQTNLDTNQDNYLTKAELLGDSRKVGSESSGGIDQRWMAWCTNLIASWDKDNDKQISLSEWEPSQGKFDSIDSDGNGLITVDEYYQYRTQGQRLQKGN